ncbi:MAG: iron chaperone [Candidatus Limnocylindrales bacterium]
MPAVKDGPEATAHIDAYLATLPDASAAALTALRRTIASTAPDAVEAISYGAPAFRYRGRPLASYAGFKDHCSLFPMGPEAIDALGDAVAAYRTAKGTLQFTPDRPLPDELVARIVRARMAILDAAKGS